jgi:hypothetical protein
VEGTQSAGLEGPRFSSSPGFYTTAEDRRPAPARTAGLGGRWPTVVVSRRGSGRMVRKHRTLFWTGWVTTRPSNAASGQQPDNNQMQLTSGAARAVDAARS